MCKAVFFFQLKAEGVTAMVTMNEEFEMHFFVPTAEVSRKLKTFNICFFFIQLALLHDLLILNVFSCRS